MGSVRLTAVPAGDVSESVEVDGIGITLGGLPQTVDDDQRARLEALDGFEYDFGDGDRYDAMSADEVAHEAAFRSVDYSGTKAATAKLLRKADAEAAGADEPDADEAPADAPAVPDPAPADGGK